MAILLLAMFIAIPIIEIGLFIEIGGWIGLWPTLAIVIVTAFAGTTLLRLQGLAVLKRAQASTARNELPVQEVFDSLCLLIAGILLLTPGFFTDGFGFLLLVPRFRDFAFDYLRARITVGSNGRAGFVHPNSTQYNKQNSSGGIIEGEFYEDTESKD